MPHSRAGVTSAILLAAALIEKLPRSVRYVLTVMDGAWIELDIACYKREDYEKVARFLGCPEEEYPKEMAIKKKLLFVTAYMEVGSCHLPKFPSPAFKTGKSVSSDGATSGSQIEYQDTNLSLLPLGRLSMPLSRLISLMDADPDRT